MTAKIKYKVKYHPRPASKIANIMFGFGVLMFVMADLFIVPFMSLPIDLQAFAILHIIPDIFWHGNNIALLSIGIGFILWLFRWRTGKIELTDEKLIIHGAYFVSIWLKNMWSVEVRDIQYARKRIILDSNVDAVQITFKTTKDFEDFSEKLIRSVQPFENVKITSTF